MKRRPWAILALLLVALLAVDGAAWARRSSSSFSRSSRSSGWSSSSRPSGWSSSRPSTPSRPSRSPSSSGWGSSSRPSGETPPNRPATPTTQPSSGGWSNRSGVQAPSSSSGARRSSSFATSGQSAIQKRSSRKAYEEYQGRFAKPANPVPDTGFATGPRPSRTWGNYGDYRTYRDRYYSSRGWSPPGYAYRSFPSFGIWDAMFLWFILRQASGPSFMYNHQNDPGIKAFRQEAEKQAQTNADLKKQLDDLDAKVEQMRRDGVPVDPKAPLPAGVDPAVALAADKVVREAPDTGDGGGMGSGLVIVMIGFGAAALFLLSSRRRRSR